MCARVYMYILCFTKYRVNGNTTTVESNDGFPGKTHKTHGWFFGDTPPGAVVMGTF